MGEKIHGLAGLKTMLDTWRFLLSCFMLILTVVQVCFAWGKVGVLKDAQGRLWGVTRHGSTVFFETVKPRPVPGLTLTNQEVRKVRALLVQAKADRHKESAATLETSQAEFIKVEKKRDGMIYLRLISDYYGEKTEVSFPLDQDDYRKALQVLAVAGADDFKDKGDVKTTKVKVDVHVP